MKMTEAMKTVEHRYVYVNRTSDRGWGLFAKEDIPAGKRVADFGGGLQEAEGLHKGRPAKCRLHSLRVAD